MQLSNLKREKARRKST